MEELIKGKIQKILVEALKAVKTISVGDQQSLQWGISFSDDFGHGDYSSNLAFVLAKRLQDSPEKLALALVKEIQAQQPWWLARVEVAKPGFINFWLSSSFLEENLKQVLKEKEKYGRGRTRKTMVIDYSSPNIAKPFGIGHLRSTIIGQAIYNIYEFLGWRCIGINHLGDWGTQFGKMIVAIRRWAKNPFQLNLENLENLYIRFHQEEKKDTSLTEEARQWFKKLENQDREALTIWKRCIRLSQNEFARIYKLLGVQIDHTQGESFYLKRAQAVIQEATVKGLAQISQGALVINLPGFKTPLLLKKSDGATTYACRDLAAIKYHRERWHPDLMIWEVGREQEFYFQQCFLAAELLGYASLPQMVHVAHGLVRWPNRKLSTREGDTVHLNEVLGKAIKKARELIEKSATSRELKEKAKEDIAQRVGIGAIKFYDLSHYPGKDIIFSWPDILNLEGNSGPYLQYTIIRGQSVLGKAGRRKKKFSEVKLTPEEEKVLRTMMKFPIVVRGAASKFSPNLIANFANELAQSFNFFYQSSPILKAPEDKKDFRLALTAGTVQVLTNCLSLLGVAIPSKM